MHYVCTGGCGMVTDQADAVCQMESCPMHGHQVVPCNCTDGQHAEVMAKAHSDQKEM